MQNHIETDVKFIAAKCLMFSSFGKTCAKTGLVVVN